MNSLAQGVDDFYQHIGFPEASFLNKRIFKRMVLGHGQLTASDKRALSEDVSTLTWKYTLKSSTVQILPYEDADREYLEVAVIEAALNSRRRAGRIAEIIQRAIPYPVVLVMLEESGLSVSVAHKRFSHAEKGGIVAEEFLRSPWMEQPFSALDQDFFDALSLQNISHTDFYALYRDIVNCVVSRLCSELTGIFSLSTELSEKERRQKLDQCHEIDRQIRSLRAAIRKESGFADKVELNTKIKELESHLAQTKGEL